MLFEGEKKRYLVLINREKLHTLACRIDKLNLVYREGKPINPLLDPKQGHSHLKDKYTETEYAGDRNILSQIKNKDKGKCLLEVYKELHHPYRRI